MAAKTGNCQLIFLAECMKNNPICLDWHFLMNRQNYFLWFFQLYCHWFEQAKPSEERGMKEKRNWGRWREIAKMEDSDTLFTGTEVYLTQTSYNYSSLQQLYYEQIKTALLHIKFIRGYGHFYLHILIISCESIRDRRETTVN